MLITLQLFLKVILNNVFIENYLKCLRRVKYLCDYKIIGATS